MKSTLTTCDIHSYLQKSITMRKVQRLCQDGELIAVKKGDGVIKHWEITAESFILWLRYHPSILPETTPFREEIFDMDSKIPYAENEVYSFKQICIILDKAPVELRKMIRNGAFQSVSKLGKITGFTKEVPVLDLVAYLSKNKQILERMQDRYILLLAHGSPHLDLIRHILMLCAYYEKNGYLV